MILFRTITVLLFLVAQSAFAQIEKGAIRIGGSISYSSTDTKAAYTGISGAFDSNQKTFMFNPGIGYFLLNNFSVGLSAPITSTQSSTYKYSSFTIGPALRYYFMLDKKMALFPEVSYTLGQSSTDVIYRAGSVYSEGSYSQLNTFKAGLGVTYFLGECVGLEATYLYKHDQERNDVVTSGYFSLGFQVYLSKKKAE